MQGCTLCAKSCPNSAITIETEKREDAPGRVLTKFEIDLGLCMYCGICVENCPSNGLRHTGDFENASPSARGHDPRAVPRASAASRSATRRLKAVMPSDPRRLFFFYLYAAIALAGALGLVLAKKLAHSLMCVFATLVAVAALFLLLDAEFLAAMQLFVYGGAVTILMLFALMLSGEAAEAEQALKPSVIAGWPAVACVAFFAMLVLTIGWAKWPLAPSAPIDTAAIATILFSKYLVPFEIAGLALTVALIGSIVMSREDDHADAGVTRR